MRLYNRAMDVYIEYVIISNLLIDSLLAYITLSALKTRCGALRIAASAAIGTLVAALMPIIDFAWLRVVLKIVVLPLVVLLMSKYKSVKKYLSALLIYAALTAMLGGLVYILRSFTTDKVYYTAISPNTLVPAYCSGGMILLLYIVRQIRGIAHKAAMRGCECKVNLQVKDCKICCEGYIDSGNTLAHNGRGVPVIDRRIAKQLMSNGAEKSGGIWVKTISGETYLKTIKIDSICFEGQKKPSVYDVRAAVAIEKLSKYKVILPVNI